MGVALKIGLENIPVFLSDSGVGEPTVSGGLTIGTSLGFTDIFKKSFNLYYQTVEPDFHRKTTVSFSNKS